MHPRRPRGGEFCLVLVFITQSASSFVSAFALALGAEPAPLSLPLRTRRHRDCQTEGSEIQAWTRAGDMVRAALADSLGRAGRCVSAPAAVWGQRGCGPQRRLRETPEQQQALRGQAPESPLWADWGGGRLRKAGAASLEPPPAPGHHVPISRFRGPVSAPLRKLSQHSLTSALPFRGAPAPIP